jgi:hypothetical protein
MEEQKHIVVGVWTILRPDTRQYKQQSIEIQLEQGVAVEVPAEMIYKSVTDKETGEIRDILTPAGVRYVQEQFEKLFAAGEGQWDDHLEQAVTKVDVKEDGWEDEGFPAPEEPVVSAPVAEDVFEDGPPEPAGEDGWGDTSVFEDDSTTPNVETDEKWDDDWN